MTEYFTDTPSGRKSITLGKKLGEGTTGIVYRISGRPGEVAKIYKTPRDASDHDEKTAEMIAGGSPALDDIEWGGKRHKQIAWPTEQIFDKSGKFRGIVMAEIDFSKSKSVENLINVIGRKKENISEFYGLRLTVAVNLASVFAEVHRCQHYMIDMKPINLRFYVDQGYACLIDTDGFSIKGANKRLAARHYSDDYIAPEGKGRSPEKLGVQQDLFALAAIIFQLLNNGLHPYHFRTEHDDLFNLQLQERIFRNLYAYGLAPHADVEPMRSSLHETFPDATRKLFDQAFRTSNRPTAAQWRDHLMPFASGNGVTRCTTNRDHLYFGKACRMCALQKQVGTPPPKRTQASVTQIPLMTSPPPAPPPPPPPVTITTPTPPVIPPEPNWPLRIMLGIAAIGGIAWLGSGVETPVAGPNAADAATDAAMATPAPPPPDPEMEARRKWRETYTDQLYSGETVTVVTTNGANTRAYPAGGNDTPITGELPAGRQLTGQWVKGYTPDQPYLRVDEGNGPFYVWGANLKLAVNAADAAAAAADAAAAASSSDQQFMSSIPGIESNNGPRWYVIIANTPPREGGLNVAKRKSQEFGKCLLRVVSYELTPWTARSDQIEGFQPGFTTSLMGGFTSKADADRLLAISRRCEPFAYVKQGTWRG